MRKTHQGRFTPKHPEKYVGNHRNIIFRSSWELKLFKYLDEQSAVKKWGSEEFCINYYDPTTQQNRRYFPDVFVIVKQGDTERKILIEVKPFEQTIPPLMKTTKNGKPTQGYLVEEATYKTNEAKWDAARTFCKEHNVQFAIFTEYELGIKKR
jgi:hypothetical protein